MKIIFHTDHFQFPYTDLKFPGQASDERILFVTRESHLMLYMRILAVIIISLSLLFSSLFVGFFIPGFDAQLRTNFVFVGILLATLFLLAGIWWIRTLWQKSVFILTTRRLTKFIYTTPWNRYNLSLSLDKIVDTGAYTRGILQSISQLGSFAARSSAGNRAEKYFYIENIHRAEDLKNYVEKVLHALTKKPDLIDTFRPFLPHLKGDKRKEFMKKFPEYWS